MAGITRFEEIEAWKTSRQLTALIYKLSEQSAFVKDLLINHRVRSVAL